MTRLRPIPDAAARGIVRQLFMAGCPLDRDRLLSLYPIRLQVGHAHIVPCNERHVSIKISAQVKVVSRVTFAGFELWAPDNTQIHLLPAQRCRTHRAYCVHDEDGCSVTVPSCLEHEIKTALAVKRTAFMASGDVFTGEVAGIAQEDIATEGETCVPVFLIAKDTFGREYVFPISLTVVDEQPLFEVRARYTQDEIAEFAEVERYEQELAALYKRLGL